jgi:hypothetical protein
MVEKALVYPARLARRRVAPSGASFLKPWAAELVVAEVYSHLVDE